MKSKALLILLCFAQFMLILDVTVVAVAMPSMQDGLGLLPTELPWLAAAYTLTYGGFMVSAGRAADLFGSRRILLAGLVIFTAASVACGLATGGAMLFTARAIQGFGAALVSPAALALLTRTFAEGAARNRALGMWGAVATGGGIAGNLLGGVLTDLLGWRSIFWINLPIGIAVIAAVALLVPPDPARTAAGRTDVLGATLLTGSVVLIVASVVQAEQGLSAAVLLTGALGVAMLGAFVVVERRAAEPVVKLAMFRNPHVRYGNLVLAASAVAALASMFFGTLYLQGVLQLSPFQTGLGFTPVLVAILLISSRAGALVARFGTSRLLVLAALLVGAGLLLLSFVRADGSYWTDVLPGLTLAGMGAGLSFAPAMIVATTGIPEADQGLAGGLVNTSSQLGGALGLAVLNTVASSVIPAAGAGPEQLVAGYRTGFLWSLVVPLLMLACALLHVRSTRKERNYSANASGGGQTQTKLRSP
jgi:EmrB/QacA subfamily drug resistance transporter